MQARQTRSSNITPIPQAPVQQAPLKVKRLNSYPVKSYKDFSPST
jgi:hypothetical protein